MRERNNEGHPKAAVLHSYNMKPSMFKRLIQFVEKNQSFDFQYDNDLKWDNLARFSDKELIQIIRGPGVKEEFVESFAFHLKNLRRWLKDTGTRIPFSEENKQNVEANLEYESDFIEKQNKNRKTQLGSLWIQAQHRQPLLRILKDSNDPAAAEMLSYMTESLDRREENIIEEIPDIDWQEVEAGYEIVISNYFRPTIEVIRRWDAKVGIFDVSLVQTYAKMNGSHYALFLDLDTRGEPLAWDLRTTREANKKLIERLESRIPSTRGAQVITPKNRHIGTNDQKRLGGNLQRD